jgi:hypothetical protein
VPGGLGALAASQKNMQLRYNFGKNVFGNPSFDIETEEYWMLIDLRHLEKEALIAIVEKLEMVLEGKLEEYEFGWDYTIIDFRKEDATVHYDFFGQQIKIEPKLLYQMMHDWRDYLINHADK